MKLFLLYRDKPILWVTGLSDVFKNSPVSSAQRKNRESKSHNDQDFRDFRNSLSNGRSASRDSDHDPLANCRTIKDPLRRNV